MNSKSNVKGVRKEMKAKNPYAKGSDYQIIATEGAKHVWKSRRALAQHCAKILRKSEELVRFSVDVVCYLGQNSNRGSEAVKTQGGIRIRYVAKA
jgi:hypothetical protein